MNDLISRQAAIEAIEEYADRLQMVNWKENPGVPYKAYALNWCINTIRDLPSAQTERPKGEWIDNETSYADGVRQTCTCSVCGIRSVRPLGDFCRWCGADMREDTDNKTTVCPMCFDCPDNCPFGADMRKENR